MTVKGSELPIGIYTYDALQDQAFTDNRHMLKAYGQNTDFNASISRIKDRRTSSSFRMKREPSVIAAPLGDGPGDGPGEGSGVQYTQPAQSAAAVVFDPVGDGVELAPTQGMLVKER